MSKIKIDDDVLTDDLYFILTNKCGYIDGYVRGIEMTGVNPEKYNLLSTHGNIIAVLCYRRNTFTITCTNSIFHGYPEKIYERRQIQDDPKCGCFTAENRMRYLSEGIDIVNQHYSVEYDKRSRAQYKIKAIPVKCNITNSLENKNKSSSNKPVISYEEAILMVLRDHRILRQYEFPEANKDMGMTEEHANLELSRLLIAMKTPLHPIDTKILAIRIRTINTIFNKDDGDFSEIFLKYSALGSDHLYIYLTIFHMIKKIKDLNGSFIFNLLYQVFPFSHSVPCQSNAGIRYRDISARYFDAVSLMNRSMLTIERFLSYSVHARRDLDSEAVFIDIGSICENLFALGHMISINFPSMYSVAYSPVIIGTLIPRSYIISCNFFECTFS